MRLTSIDVIRFLAIASGMAGCATAAPQSPIPVEIRRGGDDGLTQRFADALETGIRRSGTFTMVSGVSQPDFLVFNIPSHLEWTRVGDRVRARFQVELRRGDSSLLGLSSGDCWETQLEICAARVLNDARRVARSSRWKGNGKSHVTVPVSITHRVSCTSPWRYERPDLTGYARIDSENVADLVRRAQENFSLSPIAPRFQAPIELGEAARRSDGRTMMAFYFGESDRHAIYIFNARGEIIDRYVHSYWR
ncbi:MAG TPA: hypothetical protein VMS43_00260 [Allosphingosinicella sp.]|nr:hypothetical protein [Allosphingosinicella sp.]